MNINEQYQEVFDRMPAVISPNLTFMEIAGFPHYENVCSNILKFFFTPNPKLNGLNNILFKSFLQAIGNDDLATVEHNLITVRREVVTKTGRIDLILFNNDWVIAIENKIYHHLNNDLNDYAAFVDKEFKRRHIIKVVLSLKNESGDLNGGFINLTYKKLIENIEKNLSSFPTETTDPYYLIFLQFIQTIKNLYMPVQMEEEEIKFLINNEDKIHQLQKLEDKFSAYINQRSARIRDAMKPGNYTDKWVYDGYDVGFHFENGSVRYKMECLLNRSGISIVICVEINKVDWTELEKLDLFKNTKPEIFKLNQEGNRIILEEGIDFFIKDDELINKLEKIIEQIKISEPIHEQLN